jgi:hypothetical protein
VPGAGVNCLPNSQIALVWFWGDKGLFNVHFLHFGNQAPGLRIVEGRLRGRFDPVLKSLHRSLLDALGCVDGEAEGVTDFVGNVLVGPRINLARSKSTPARPYMARFSVLSLLI